MLANAFLSSEKLFCESVSLSPSPVSIIGSITSLRGRTINLSYCSHFFTDLNTLKRSYITKLSIPERYTPLYFIGELKLTVIDENGGTLTIIF